MRLIYITDFYYTVDSGAKTSARAHLKTLQNIFGIENLKVIALVGSKYSTEIEPGHVAIEGTKNKIFLLFKCLIGYTTYLNRSGILHIMSIINEYNPDIIFIDNSIYGKLVQTIKQSRKDVLVISFYHDVKAKLAADWMKSAPLYKKPVYKAMMTNERLNAKYCDINLTLNTKESLLYKNAYGKDPETELSIYMDIQLKENYFDRKRNDGRIRLLFFGGYYLPNINGIDWFVRNVLPKLSDKIELQIAGRSMDRLKERNYPKNVYIQGIVNNLDEIYRDADIVISPIFEGGGMKVKIAEAMAYGKVIVGSDDSYNGYKEKIPHFMWNKYFFRANTSEEFINVINEITKKKISFYNSEIRQIYENSFSEKYAQKVISEIINNYLRENKP